MNSYATHIINNWPLDDWIINVEVFSKIVEILPFGSTILEFGSGASSNILKNFYKVISVEDNENFLNKYNGMEYIYAESDKQGYNFTKLKVMIKLRDLIKEEYDEHENDRDMVTGVAEILLMVKDKENRKEIADNMVNKFKSEKVIFDKDEFLKMCQL